jgi:hypothetical protein
VPRSAALVTVPWEDTTRYLEEGDPVNFSDAKLTGGATLFGWIHAIADEPGDGGKVDVIRISLTLEPEEFESLLNLIDENGADEDSIIDENEADSGDIIDENGA